MLLKSESVCEDKVLGLGQMKMQKSICEIYLWTSIHLQSKTGVGQPSERPLESIISRLAVQRQMKSMIVGSSRRSISVKRVGWHVSGPTTEQSRAEASTSQSEKWNKNSWQQSSARPAAFSDVIIDLECHLGSEESTPVSQESRKDLTAIHG